MTETYIETSLDNVDKITGEKYFSFKSECSCFSHDLKIQLESNNLNDDKNGKKIIEMTFYDDVWIGEDFDLYSKSFLKRILFRLKLAWKCLFKDGFEVEHGFVFKGEKHLRQFQKYFNERANTILSKQIVKSEKRKTYKRPYKNFKGSKEA